MANMIHAAAAKHRERMKEQQEGLGSPTKEGGGGQSPVKTVLGAFGRGSNAGLHPQLKEKHHVDEGSKWLAPFKYKFHFHMNFTHESQHTKKTFLP